MESQVNVRGIHLLGRQHPERLPVLALVQHAVHHFRAHLANPALAIGVVMNLVAPFLRRAGLSVAGILGRRHLIARPDQEDQRRSVSHILPSR
ncbi:hypothetical protein D3C80_1915630 [compost metagenome]